MRLFALLLALILTYCPVARADDFLESVTFNDAPPPGSIILKYDGIQGLIVDEIRRQLYNQWTSQINQWWEWDRITLHEYLSHSYYISAVSAEHDRIGNWWDRKWFESLGAITPPAIYQVGRKQDIADFGFFQITSKGKLKLTEYRVKLYDIELPEPSMHWKLRVRPSLKLSTPDFFNNVEISLVFDYFVNRKLNILRIETFAGYDRRKGSYVGLDIVLPLW
jgi:hypothetical protein